MNTCTYNKWCSPHPDGQSCACTCHPKENTMTKLIPGKRYRWTVEGTVGGDGDFYIATSDYMEPSWLACGTVELLPDPLPTTPGSVVRVEGMTFMRQQDGHWGTQGGTAVNDVYMSRWTDFTVLFDAGAERA